MSLVPLGFVPLGFWVSEPWNLALKKGIWDPKPRVTNMKGTSLKPLTIKVFKESETRILEHMQASTVLPETLYPQLETASHQDISPGDSPEGVMMSATGKYFLQNLLDNGSSLGTILGTVLNHKRDHICTLQGALIRLMLTVDHNPKPYTQA